MAATSPSVFQHVYFAKPLCFLPRSILQLTKIGIEIRYGRGARIFGERESPSHIYILRAGRVKLYISSPRGKTLVLKIAQHGEVLGLPAALNAMPYEATAESLEPCNVVAVQVNDFHAYLARDPSAAVEITHCILREYRLALSGVCRLALPATIAGRIAALLLCWLKWQSTNENSRSFLMTLTHDEIAGMTGTTRETVSRVLRKFRRQRLISIRGSSFTVLETEGLEALAV